MTTRFPLFPPFLLRLEGACVLLATVTFYFWRGGPWWLLLSLMSNHFYNLYLISSDPPGSPDYYTTVVVANAIQFWDNGHYIRGSQWRHDYGPFTQFPHRDSGGNADANDGSHGCINVSPEFLKNLDPGITSQTRLIIF